MSTNHKIEIDDLIGDAVANAIARRNDIQPLSGEEASSISGGLTASDKGTTPGKNPKPKFEEIKFCPPIVVGLVAVDFPKSSLS